MSTQTIVIIGSGLAGYMLAKELRKLDKESGLEIISADGGEFYSKPLLSTGLAQGKQAEALAMFSAQEMGYQLSAKIHVHTHIQAIDTDAKKIQSKDETIAYDRLVLACGAQTKSLALTNELPNDKCLSINNLQDYIVFRRWLADKKHIAILGCGLVGCEFANDLIKAGYQVTMIAPDAYPLAKFIPEEVGQILQQVLAEHGVEWQLMRTPTAIDTTNNKVAIALDNGEQVLADGVISAVGLTPSIALAQQAGIVTAKGISVDRYLQTSVPDIYALGDCAEVQGEIKQYVAPLLQCARALAKTLAGNKTQVDYPAMPIVIKTTLCPLTCIPPPLHCAGEWQFSGAGIDRQALFYDQQGILQGYALLGQSVRNKMALTKQIPAVFT